MTDNERRDVSMLTLRKQVIKFCEWYDLRPSDVWRCIDNFIDELEKCEKQYSEEVKEEHVRKFEEIVVEYPSAEICPYPEYKGKPYFSIKFKENGGYIIGFGTYKPEVLSEYIREYFINPIAIEADKEEEE